MCRPTEPGLLGRLQSAPCNSRSYRGLIVARDQSVARLLRIDQLKPDLQVQQTTFCLCVLLLAGCARQGSPIEAVSPAAVPKNRSPDSTATFVISLATLYSPGSVHYRYQATSVTESTLGDSIPRIDSMHVTALLSATFQASSSPGLIQVITQADSIQLALKPNAGVMGARVELSQRGKQQDTLEINRMTGQVRSRPYTRSCNQETIDPVFRGDEIIPTLPERVPISKTLVDTLTREICRGGVLLHMTQITRSELAPYSKTDSTAGYRVIRFTETQLSGTGLQWQQSVEVSGHGTTTDTLTISHFGSLRLQHVVTTSRAEIGFRSTRRNQRFSQTVTTKITMRP